MPDFRVTFKGDTGNLAQWDAAIKNAAIGSARAIEASNTRVASSIGKISGAFNEATSGAGLWKNRTMTAVDAVNNTFIQSGQIIRRSITGYTAELNKATGRRTLKPVFDDQYLGSFKQAIGNVQAYEKAIQRLIPHERELQGVRRGAAKTQVTLGNQRADLADKRKETEEALKNDVNLNNARIAMANAEAEYLAAQSRLSNFAKGQRGIGPARAEVKRTADEFAAATATVSRLEAPYAAAIDGIVKADEKLANRIAGSDRVAGRRERSILRRTAFGDVQAAIDATPPIQNNLAQVLAQSQDVRKNLIKGGLGQGTQYGTQEFQRVLAAQEAAVTSYTKNLRTNVTTVAGEFKNLQTGVLQKFTVDLDEQGKVIGRWGGQLSGAGSILRQTVRDFQKVIEWTVATTVVFGTLATVVGQLQNINELNTALARFSITAQTSAEETKTFFQDLTNVAISTATPLQELVKVADDIALATREAGDSTDVWKQKIIDLTTAVGIFTNLTGTDTVQAADQLSSTFKQLNVAPSELIGILNKVTAVSGGQATAIADIVKSLSGLAEAAKAAGFNVDEMIASVQVLSQVTNKTSAEVATSFKNLFGSVSSVGSEKILKEFGIEIRDASGGIRDFLDIYRDVKRALDSGIIPQNRLPDVLRGLAGGPRRAPDAAALLSNIDRIDSVVQKSANATNEALIANAKILDTNQAKIVQFQNAIDSAVFQQFGEAVKDLTGTLATFGTAFARFLKAFDSGTIATVIKVGLLVGGLYTFVKVLGLLSKALGIGAALNGLKAMATGMKAVTAEATLASAAIQSMALADARLGTAGLAAQGPGIMSGLGGGKGGILGKLNKYKIPLLIGGAGVAGAVAGNQSGGGLNDLATGLTVAGGLATLVPGLQAVGIAASVAGIAISLFSKDSSDAKKSTAALSSEIYTLIQGMQSTQASADEYAKTQKESVAIIKDLKDKTGLTADEQARLSDATTNYVTSTLALAEANRQVSSTFDDILSKLNDLGPKYAQFRNIAAISPNDPLIKTIQERLAKDILTQSGQGVYSGQTIPVASSFRNRASKGNVVTGGTFDVVTGPGGEVFDLRKLLDQPDMLRKIFGLDRPTSSPFYGKEQFGGIPRNEGSIRLVQGALTQLLEEFRQGTGTFTEDELKRLSEVISQLSKDASSFTQNTAALAQLQANIQSKVITGQFTGTQAANASQAAGIAARLNQQAGPTARTVQTRLPNGRIVEQIAPEYKAQIQLIQELSKAAEQGVALTSQQLEAAAINGLKLSQTYDGLREAGDSALKQGIVQWLKDAGVGQETLDALAKQYNLTLQQTNQLNAEGAAAWETARQAAADAFGQRQLQLEIQQNSGDFAKNSEGLAVLKKQNQEAYQSALQLISAMEQMSQTSLVDLNNSLSQTIGLQGQYITQTQLSSFEAGELEGKVAGTTAQLLENAVAAGVNAAGIDKITKHILGMIAAIQAIPPYKQVIIDIQTSIDTLSKSNLGFGPAGAYQKLEKLKKQQAKAPDISKIINDTIKYINNVIKSGTGSSFGGLSSAGGGGGGGGGTPAYNKPGLLDIPKELLQQANFQQLLQQAVKNARSLQSKVPGETKANKGEIVELLNGTKRVLETRGIGEDYLRRALDELTEQVKRQNDFLTKADTIRRIRVGSGSFAALANVPVNSKTGVSVGGANAVNVTLNLNGTVLTPAQFQLFADQVAAAIKRQLAS